VASLGLGLYTLKEASRLLDVDVRALNRWLFGYRYTVTEAGKRREGYSPGLWNPQYDPIELGEKVIGFHDLLEARIVREFVRAGVSLLVVRHCLERAKDKFGAHYPLTAQRFVTDGETIFHEAHRAANETGDPALLNLKNLQYTFKSISRSSLYAGIEYLDAEAKRWYPNGARSPVLMDPAIGFGHPVIKGTGVRTETLYAAYVAEGKDRGRVARLFNVNAQDVGAAVKFEAKLHRTA
jgi:uncharacterized protein (DUF433 family)